MMRHLRMLRLLLAGLVAGAPIAHPIVRAIPVVASAVAPAAAVALSVALSDVAHAGAVLDGSNDRIDVGTGGGFGSQEKDSDGWSLMCWLKTSQVSVASTLFNFTTGAEGAVGSFNQSLMFDLQTGWTTDYVSDVDHVTFDLGDQNDDGLLWHQELSGVTIANGVLQHHALTVIATGNHVPGGDTANSGATIVYYNNGTAFPTWTKTYSGGLDVVHDFSSTLAIGAERKNGGTWFDWTAGTFVDCRVYTVALTANEINEIYLGRGRDSVTHGLLRRWPLDTSGCSEYMAGAPCVPQNGPTWSASYELDGIRRRN